MGSAFNCEMLHSGIETKAELAATYKELRQALIANAEAEHGECAYTGNLAVDDGKLIVSDLGFDLSEGQEQALREYEAWGHFPDEDVLGGIQDAVGELTEKWGSSVAVKVNGSWAIMGFYSD